MTTFGSNFGVQGFISRILLLDVDINISSLISRDKIIELPGIIILTDCQHFPFIFQGGVGTTWEYNEI